MGDANNVRTDTTLHLAGEDRSAPMLDGAAVPPECLIAGRYQLLDVLAEGGMGRVHKGWDHVLKRPVAVKVMQERMVSPFALRRFEHEARITGQLQHPSIPPVHDLGSLPNGMPFLVMKLIRGDTLDALIQKPDARLNVAGIFESICQAIGYAHSHGVLHRDLKPVNVMVGAFGEVQVMDWGLAKLVREKNVPATETTHDTAVSQPPSYDHDSGTMAGSVLGTPAYMPPEQALGALDQITTRSDVFGLGGILCAMLTGKPVFVGTDAEKTRQLSARGRVEDAYSRLDACGAEPELIALAKRCLALDPQARPADGNEVATLVDRLRADADERARQAEVGRNEALVREAELRKRRLLLAWSAAVVVVVLSSGILVSIHQTRRALDAEEATADYLGETFRAKKAADAERAKAVLFRDKALDALRAATNEDVEQLIGTRKELTAGERAYLEAIARRWKEFASLESTDETSLEIRSEGHFLVASLWQKLGRREEARAEFERAIALQEKLASSFPDVADHRFGLARSRSNFGVLLHELGDIAGGIRQFQAARKMLEHLIATTPATTGYRVELARIHHNLGVLHNEEGRRDEAEAHYREGLTLQETLVAEFPAIPAYRSALAASLDSLGQMFAAIGRRDAAEPLYRRGLALREKLADEFPHSAEFGNDLSRSQTSYGLLLRQLGRRDDAAEQYRRALATRTKLAAAFPAIPDYCAELAHSHGHLGNLHTEMRDNENAEKEFRRALALQQQLVADFTTVPSYRLDLASTYMNLGVILHGAGRSAEARELLHTGLGIQQKLAADHPATTDYKVILGGSHCNIANLERDDGKLEDSLTYFAAAIETLIPVHAADPRAVVAKRFLRNSHWGRARALDLLHHHAESLADWERTIELSGTEQHSALRAERLTTMLCAGRVAEAASEVEALRKLPGWKPGDFVTFARVAAASSEKFPDARQQHADTAMQLLQQAVAAGWTNAVQLKTDPDLAPLRTRPDFQKLSTSPAN